VLDNFFSGKRENLAEVAADVDLQEGDVRDDAAVARALAGVELVFHEAAIPSVPRSLVDPIGSNEANATATLKVLHHAKKAGVRRVVYAASSSAYGDTPSRSSQASTTVRSTRAPTGSRQSACATSTSSARARIPPPNTRPSSPAS
jgi:nucleoside-diphosphate-sugar epimerase